MKSIRNILSLDNNISSMKDKPGKRNGSTEEDSQSLPGTTLHSGGSLLPVPSPEVSERASRKKFTAKYKLRILNEIDSASQRGEVGSILRREGLYSSNISSWRKQRKRGELEGLSPGKRGPKSAKPDPKDKQIKELERQNRKLQRKLARANLLIDIQKKISEIMEIPMAEVKEEEDDL